MPSRRTASPRAAQGRWIPAGTGALPRATHVSAASRRPPERPTAPCAAWSSASIVATDLPAHLRALGAEPVQSLGEPGDLVGGLPGTIFSRFGRGQDGIAPPSPVRPALVLLPSAGSLAEIREGVRRSGPDSLVT